MKVIKRKMTVETEQINGDPSCQASFNSDGALTLRHRSSSSPNDDTVIVLSRSETEAIFELFRQLKSKISMADLPF